MAKKISKKATKGGPAKAAPRRTTKSRPQQIPRAPSLPKAAVEAVCSIVDPFCPAADGAKTFDISSARSIPFTTRFQTGFVNDATGAGGIWLLPFHQVQVFGGAVTAGSTFTATTSGTAPGVPLPGVVDKYRLVSMGCIIRCVGAVLNRAGTVYVRLFGGDPSTLSVVDLRTYNANECFAFPITADADPVYVVNRKVSALADIFVEPIISTDFVTQTDNGWSYILVGVVGGEIGKVAVEIEAVYHWELIAGDGSTFQQLATHTRPPNAVVNSAIAKVNEGPAAVQAPQSGIGDWFVKKAVTGLTNALGTAIGPEGMLAAKQLNMMLGF